MSIEIRVKRDDGNVDTVGFVTCSSRQTVVRNQGILGYENHPTLYYLIRNQNRSWVGFVVRLVER
jgi:hypothetical protein